MKTIYIDSDFRCHLENTNGDYRKIETDFFDGKCDEFIEGYRYIPSDERWTREDGEEFVGEMISPHADFNELLIAQMAYEKEDADNALSILLGGGV